jgi:Na+/melibiose symporter-like transporter
MVVGKTGVPPIYILFVGGVLQIVGTIGLSKTPTSFEIWGAQYVFQIIAGLGNGCINPILLLAVPVVEKRDLGKHRQRYRGREEN